jgi:hypothetical protein
MIFNPDRLHGRQNGACPDGGEPLGTQDDRRAGRTTILSPMKRTE